MESPRYTLQKYAGIASRHQCPACGKSRVFSRYVNTETSEYLADHVGRCNREVECGYHYKPADYFADNPGATRPRHSLDYTPKSNVKPTIASFIPRNFFEASLNHIHFENNHFVLYLKSILGSKWQEAVNRFCIGSANRWPGSVVFWQIDNTGKIRTGKIMDYNPVTGKRIKNRITWAHGELQKKGLIKDFNLNQCLFGEHQLASEPLRPVGIVESEKTAIIASTYMPELIWMACGGLNGISCDRFIPIKNNSIILYPDIKGFEKWSAKANELREKGFRVTVSDLLEKATFVTDMERANGFDLADYLPRVPLPVTKLEVMEARNPLVKELIKRFELTQTIPKANPNRNRNFTKNNHPNAPVKL